MRDKAVSSAWKMNYKLTFTLSCLIFAISGGNSFAVINDVEVRNAISSGVDELAFQQNSSVGSWGNAQGLDYIYTASAVEALRSANQRTGAYYSGIAWLENHHANNTDLTARKVAALIKYGNFSHDLARLHAAKRDLQQSGWGLSAGYNNSALETALVLQSLYQAEDATGRDAAINYLLSNQLVDGGWSVVEAATSDYWITAEAVIALANYQGHVGVPAALTSATAFLSGIAPATTSTPTLARATLALHTINGVDATVDSFVTSLLAKQVTAGDWGDALSSSNAITTLSHVVGLNQLSDSTRVAVDQERLRTVINQQLGHAAYGHITQADLERITYLDLRSQDISNLNGLEWAVDLSLLKVNASTDLSAISGLTGVTIIIDSDSDDIVDATDICPNNYDPDQANLDGDALGDACDPDLDGDTMLDSWEITYSLNNYNALDAGFDPDTDQLTNLEEFNWGTNPQNPDHDGDEIKDGIEVLFSLNPLDANDAQLNYDEDLLTNIEETVFGTDPYDADTDKDNADDYYEVSVGRNPLVNEPVLIIVVNSLLLD